MNKDILNKLYWGFWFSTTVLTGIMAGFMISHSIMFGRFLSWFVESDNLDLLRQTYTLFRETSSPNPDHVYNIPLYLCLVSGVIWVVLSFLVKKDRIIAVFAGLSTYWVGSIFMLIDLDEAEAAVTAGVANADMAKFFASINVPCHVSFAAIYCACFCLLLFIAMKARRTGVRAAVGASPVPGKAEKPGT